MSVSAIRVQTAAGFAGILAHEAGEYQFSYMPGRDAGRAIALGMPVRLKPYAHRGLHPIFQMNLPEGFLLERLRNLLAKTSGTDPMLLLTVFGGAHAIGRLQCEPLASAQPARSVAPATAEEGEALADILAYRGAGTLFDILLDRYLLRSGLSGVQPKVLVPERADASGGAAGGDLDDPPRKAAARTADLIVKSGLAAYPGLAVNEFICMSIVQRAGIPCPEFFLSDDHALFVMRRFDRTEQGAALGFEDMAVLAGKDADQKYDGSYEIVARLLRLYCSADHLQAALRQLFDMLALSCMLGNGDAHLKNFGVLYADVANGPVWMAPAYDIVNTTAYLPEDNLALSLSGNRDLFASRQGLLDFARHCDLSVEQARVRIRSLIDTCDTVLQELAELVDEVPDLSRVLEDRLQRFRSSFT
jgi:serine/threonine-protein kinase HipA